VLAAKGGLLEFTALCMTVLKDIDTPQDNHKVL